MALNNPFLLGVVFIMTLNLTGVFSCKKKSCSWQTCSESYSGYSPSPGQGRCVWQYSRVSHTYRKHSRSSGCPSSTSCYGRDRSRYLCSCKQITACWWASWGSWAGNIPHGTCRGQNRYRNEQSRHRYITREGSCSGIQNRCYGNSNKQQRTMCSCKQVTQCWWASWGAWTGNIGHGTCGKQNRYRKEESRHRYITKQGSCNGVQHSCTGNYFSEERKMCSCKKKVSCPVAPWTSWTPVVPTGQCIEQTQYQDKLPQVTYVQKLNDCVGIVADCYPKKIVNKRRHCSCGYKDCVEGAWTAWEIKSWTGNCPNQRRFRQYRAIKKYKMQLYDCGSVGPQDCKDDTGQTRQKEVTCPKLPVPANGIHKDTACNGANSDCDSMCRLDCKPGFRLTGNKYVTCHGSEQWDRPQGTCADIDPPVIKCPTVGQYYNDPNENYGDIDLKSATATDNSGQAVKITTSHKFPLRVSVGQPVKVIYTATDEAGNKATCARTYSVFDNEPPKVVRCPPKHRLIQTEKLPHIVYWDEPKFHDNVDSEGDLTIIPSNYNGSPFPKGVHTVTVNARDKSGKTANCTFSIELEMVKCAVPKPPKHGSRSCSVEKNGVKEAYICTIACQKGWWFLQGPSFPKAHNYYLCNEGGSWTGGKSIFNRTEIPDLQIIPKGQPLWPDCSVGLSPDGVELDMQVFGGSCNDQTVIDKLKEDFVKTMKKDLIVNTIFCSLNTQHCTVENIVVYCAKRKRRNADGSQSSQIVIKFSFAVRDKSLSSSATPDMTKLNALSLTLEKEKANILQKVKNAAPRILNDYSTSVKTKSAVISCEPGYEYDTLSGSTGVKCLKCPIGTYYKSESRKCEVCDTGYYQDVEGSLSCKKCSIGKTTTGQKASDLDDCLAICEPGTYSDNGVETCFACPLATYQPLTGSKSCISCPNGKVTKQVGSTSIKECAERGIQYEIRSEGKNDPGKRQDSGYATILVDGKDHSKHQRGINLVAVNAKTGSIVSTASFDWHGDYLGCSRAVQWLFQIPDHSIILAAYQDEATNYFLYGVCDTFLQSIGGSKPFQNEYRGSFAIAGYKGKAVVSWVKQKKMGSGRGPTTLSGNIKLTTTIQYEIQSEGLEDPGKRQGAGYATILVNGKDYSKHRRGINFVALNAKTGHLIESTNYDWHGDHSGCVKAITWLSHLPDGTIVLGAVQDEATNYFRIGICDKALEWIGGKTPYYFGYRGSFSIVGYYGKVRPKWVHQKMNRRSKGPTKLSGSIILM